MGICLTKRNKNKRMHERIDERIQRKLIQQWAQENKKINDELKSVGVYVITDFIKDKVKCSTDNDDVNDDFDDDDDDDVDNEQDSVVRFIWKCHSDSWQWVYLFSVSSLISMNIINWVFLYDKIYKKWVRITMKILVCLLFYFIFLDFVCTL